MIIASHKPDLCARSYTAAQTEREARIVHASAPSQSDLHRLGRMEMCQRYPVDRGHVVAYDRRQGRLYRLRQAEAAAARARAAQEAAVAATAPTPTSNPTPAPPAPAQAATATGSGLMGCIISRESGGNPQAVNPSGHYGIAQWAPSTWIAQGGGKYGPSPLDATAAQQEQILAAALAAGDANAWLPYDGC